MKKQPKNVTSDVGSNDPMGSVAFANKMAVRTWKAIEEKDRLQLARMLYYEQYIRCDLEPMPDQGIPEAYHKAAHSLHARQRKSWLEGEMASKPDEIRKILWEEDWKHISDAAIDRIMAIFQP